MKKKELTPFEKTMQKVEKLNAREKKLKNEIKAIQRCKMECVVILCGGDVKLLEEAWK